MRSVRTGSVSIPLAVVKAYIAAFENPNAEGSSEAAMAMHKAILKANEKIENGLDHSNLTVCIGKLGHLDPVDARRFLTGEIPRITIYRDKKDNHNMPLYFKNKPSYYSKSQKPRKPQKKSKHGS